MTRRGRRPAAPDPLPAGDEAGLRGGAGAFPRASSGDEPVRCRRQRSIGQGSGVEVAGAAARQQVVAAIPVEVAGRGHLPLGRVEPMEEAAAGDGRLGRIVREESPHRAYPLINPKISNDAVLLFIYDSLNHANEFSVR